MTNCSFNQNTPILFLIFNRPDTTAKVFKAIRQAQPKKLYISADGPRSAAEAELCMQVREITEKVDWECEIYTNFADGNKGCKVAMSDGISWFFNLEEEGIILEDDCLPAPDFFGFCSTLLAHYRDDTRITHIGGSNLQLGQKRGTASYYYSNLTHVWGWAGWRRTWEHYDVNLELFPAFHEQDYIDNCPSHLPFKQRWINDLERTFNKEIDTWDYQYSFSNLINNGLSIIPNVNLISNIGFGVNATHTFDKEHFFAALPTEQLLSITHPQIMIPCVEADLFTQEKENYSPPLKKKNIFSRLWKSIKSISK